VPLQAPELAVAELERTLLESGSIWKVARVNGRVECYLERRTDSGANAAIGTVTAAGGRETEHLAEAWRLAYGREPNASEAYREAVKREYRLFSFGDAIFIEP